MYSLTADIYKTHISDEKVENLADLPNSEHGSYELKTNKGTVLKADLVIKAHGVQINTTAFQSSFGMSQHI